MNESNLFRRRRRLGLSLVAAIVAAAASGISSPRPQMPPPEPRRRRPRRPPPPQAQAQPPPPPLGFRLGSFEGQRTDEEGPGSMYTPHLSQPSGIRVSHVDSADCCRRGWLTRLKPGRIGVHGHTCLVLTVRWPRVSGFGVRLPNPDSDDSSMAKNGLYPKFNE